jgi:hypothetical protein
MKKRCKALVGTEPCQVWALRGQDFCYFHSPRPEHPAPETIIEYIKDRSRFGRAFKDLSTWQNWLTFLRTLYGLPFESGEELERFQHFTGRALAPTRPFDEAWILAGRRGGKSYTASVIAAYESLAVDWASRLSPGETANVFILAADRRQAGLIYGYVRSLITMAAPGLILRDTKDEIELANQVTISIRAGDLRSLRGYSICLCLIDEACMLRDSSGSYANPLQEVITALEPALMPARGKLPGAKLLGLSTPWGAWGVAYEKFQEAWGNDSSEILTWRGTVLEMHPGQFTQEFVDKKVRQDVGKNSAEYLAAWRSDVSNLLDEIALASAMGDHVTLPFDPTKRYFAFLDPSSLKTESFTMALGFVAPYSNQLVVCRQEEQRAPGDTGQTCEKFAKILKSYNVTRLTTDRHASGWVESEFKRHGIMVDFTSLSKSEIYTQFAGLLSLGRLWLVQDDRLTQQLLGLERRVTKGGLENVDHAAYGGAMDDLANSVAGCAVLMAQEGTGTPRTGMPIEFGGPSKKLKEIVHPGAAAIEAERDNVKIMDDWMTGQGGSRIVKKGW